MTNNRQITTVFMIAFLQGLLDLYSLPLFYHYKDNLKATAAQLSFLSGMVTLPWCIKPLFGFISDQIPILGYRRKSYLILMCILEIASLFYLAFFAKTIIETAICQFFLVTFLVFRNVIGAISKKPGSKEDEGKEQEKAQQSVSIFFGSRAFGSLIANFFTGQLAENYSHPTSFMICSCFSASLILIAIFVFKEESTVIEEESFKEQIKKISKVIFDPKFKCILIVVLLLIMTPTYPSAFNYYLTEKLHFRAELMGRISFLSSVAYLFGIFMVNTIFSNAKFENFYATTTILMAIMSSTSLILISRMNIKFGISDEFFCLSNSALSTFFSELNFLPILAFTCRLCPVGLEGSTYAMFTAIMNFAFYFSTFFGSLLVWAYHVTKTDFSNLWILVVIQVAYSLFFGVFICFYKFPGVDGELELKEDDEEKEGLVYFRDYERAKSVAHYDSKKENSVNYWLSKAGFNYTSAVA